MIGDRIDEAEAVSHIRELVLRLEPGRLRDVLATTAEAWDGGHYTSAWLTIYVEAYKQSCARE
jgi:hypothetical protein